MSKGSTSLPSVSTPTGNKTALRTLRAVSYLRVSTEEQKRGYGVARQATKTNRHIACKEWEHVDTYKDEGVSGSLEAGERGDLKRLMADALKEPRPFDIVVVTDGRAIGRKGRAFWRWVWALEDIGVFVAVVADDYDNTTAEGRKKMRRDADYAETEWETIRDRTQGGLQEKAELIESAHIGGPPPFGYYVEGKGTPESHLAVNEVEAKVIRHVYSLVVGEGLNLRKAAIRLNSEGTKTRKGRAWNIANLRDRVLSTAVLDSETVFRGAHAQTDENGDPVWGETVRIKLPRILTPEESTELRRKAAERGRHSGARREFYPLSARITGLCQKPYTGISYASQQGARYYRCSGKAPRNLGDDLCECSAIDADAIEAHVWEEVTKMASDSEKLEQLAAEWIGLKEADTVALMDRIEGLDRQIDEVNASITAVTLAAAKRTKSADAITAATATLDTELEQLQELREEASLWLAEIEESNQRARALRALAKNAQETFPGMGPVEQADVLSMLELKVTITGPVPERRHCGVPCPVRAWYKGAELGVPARPLSDGEWARVAALLPKGRSGATRRSVNAIIQKARTGKSWVMVREETGASAMASRHFGTWVADGTWARVEAALRDVDRLPLPEPNLLPSMTIEGRIDPSAMRSAEELSRRGFR
ncbi:recombinase family protein [Streptomyces sp. NPDC050147]|uniref:recombinase family protein n=1 Tax=Streptomyces sp. NPDC050147 TaxID=3155513 RepID=UPI0034329B69